MAIVVDVSSVTEPDCRTIDALAHIQLGARRLGHRIRLMGASDEMLRLIVLAGLDDVLAPGPSGVEPVGQPEEREEAGGVEEEVDSGDHSA
jgi:anti-anti-sigma regulatory factor